MQNDTVLSERRFRLVHYNTLLPLLSPSRLWLYFLDIVFWTLRFSSRYILLRAERLLETVSSAAYQCESQQADSAENDNSDDYGGWCLIIIVIIACCSCYSLHFRLLNGLLSLVKILIAFFLGLTFCIFVDCQLCLTVKLKALVTLRQSRAAIEQLNDVHGVAVVKGALWMDYIIETEFPSGRADDILIATSLSCDLILHCCALRV